MEFLLPYATRVEEQLERIFASPQFHESPRLQNFLQFVIHLSLEGKADQIKETTISSEVFGRSDMTDDTIVRSAARRLRTKLEEYYQGDGAGDPVRISIPKGSYVPDIQERVATIAPEIPPVPAAAPSLPRHRTRLYLAAAVCLAALCFAGWRLHKSSPAAHKVNPVAGNLVMKGRLDMQRSTPDAMKQAEAEFQHAIDADPQCAIAYVWMARAELAEARARGSIYRTEFERDSAAELSHKALEIDPALPEAHAILANLAMEYDWDWRTAERELRVALQGPPSATAELTYAYFLIFHGRFAEADPHLARVQELEPLDAGNMMSLVQTRYLEGRFAQAREISERAAALYPALIDAQADVAGSHIWDGKPELALAALDKIKQPTPSLPFAKAMAYARAGHAEAARNLIRPYEEKYPDCGVALQWIAKVHALLGDEAEAVKWMERSADRREWQALNIAVNPVFASMQKSPGFLKLKERMGLL